MQPNRSFVVNYFKAQLMRLSPAIIIIAFTLLMPAGLWAQDIAEADTVDMGFLMRKEQSGNIMLHTLGYGFGYRFGTKQ